ncbi:hypothetical protein SAMN05428988_0135 [Chitinophaga sp. YR573]|nr:hypothetical protein SAMN05428988_0135 [Chitinophaga sp. YR573]
MKNRFEQPPIGIMVTWGKDMIQEKGGLLAFIRYFEQTMKQEDALWLQKSKNCPTQDISYVYIIVCNQVRYRLFYGGYQSGETTIHNGNGHSWSSRQVIRWPRLVLAGPIVKAPYKIRQKGFQGFRYVTEELF